MKLAITDACIFIDLHDIQLTAAFFSLDYEMHTSVDVMNELYEHQQEVLAAYRSVHKLIVHNITEKDRLEIMSKPYPKSLSHSDKTVLFLAEKLDAIVISSDKVVRNTAKNQSVHYHGMLWILDMLIENGSISKETAAKKLKTLLKMNVTYRNNPKLMAEIQKRITMWEK